MSWSHEVIETSKNEWHRVIYDYERKKVISIVDNLDKEFVEHIIKEHNDAISDRYKKGLHDGVDIMKEQYSKKGKK